MLTRLSASLAASLLLSAAAMCREPEPPARTLQNGIPIESPWPPRLKEFPTSVERDPVTPPYLLSPPPVIPIDLGRQLFVDDFLIAETSLERTYHLARYHPASPVLRPDRPWETAARDHPAAMAST